MWFKFENVDFTFAGYVHTFYFIIIFRLVQIFFIHQQQSMVRA